MDAGWVSSSLFERPGFHSRERVAISQPREELAARIANLAETDPALFLERYGSALTHEELSHFDGLANDYEVGWHLRSLRRSSSERAQQARNRRFRALAQLEQAGDFFSDHEMQRRAPQLYHQYVGCFLTSDGVPQVFQDESLSERLLANYEADEAARARRVAEEAERLEREEEEDEEEDADDEDEAEAAVMAAASATAVVMPPGELEHCFASTNPRVVNGVSHSTPGSRQQEDAEDDDEEDKDIGRDAHAAYLTSGLRVLREERAARGSDMGTHAMDADMSLTASEEAEARLRARQSHERQQRAREELMRIMRERFLAGDDHAFFDYATRCDNNLEFDDHEQEARDAEERWFDDD